MSIANEITRLQNAKASIKSSIENKGVTVPSATTLDGYSTLIDSISTQPDLEIGTETITQNGSNIYFPTTGKDGFSQFIVNVNVPGGGIDWSDTGYSSTPITINEAHIAAKQVYDNWDSIISDRTSAFENDTTLTVFPKVDVSSITVGTNMFKKSRITEINLNLPGGIYDGMFTNCTDLKIVNISSTGRNYVNGLFSGCTKLKTINFNGSSFDVSYGPYSSNYLQKMFYNCSSLETLDLSNWVSYVENGHPNCNIESVSEMFRNCKNLRHIDFWNNIKFSSSYGNFDSNGFQNVFSNCPNLDDATLNGILKFPINTPAEYYNLSYMGLSQAQAKRCQNQVNYIVFDSIGINDSRKGHTGYTVLDTLARIGSITNLSDFGDTITNYIVGVNTSLDTYYSSGAAYRVIIYENNVQCIAGDVDTSNHFISDDGTLEFDIQVDTLTSEYELVNITKNINN